jgi:hypothetical protein
MPITKKDVVSVDSDRRFELDQTIIKEVLGLTLRPESNDYLWMFLGSKKQLRVLRKDHPLSTEMERYEAGKMGIKPNWDADDDEDADVNLKLLNFMKLRFNRSESRDRRKTLSITLPAEAINLGYARINSSIIVLTAGQVFQLWHPDIWTDVCKILKLKDFTEQIQRIATID